MSRSINRSFRFLKSINYSFSTSIVEYQKQDGVQEQSQLKAWFLSRGMTDSEYHKLISRYPRLTEWTLEQPISRKLEFLWEEGMNGQGIVRFFDQLLRDYPEFLELDLDHEIQPMFNFLLQIGFQNEEILIMIIKFPQILSYDVESIFQKRIQFLEEQAFPKEDIMQILFRFPQIVEVSLDHNIAPLVTYLLQELEFSLTDIQKIFRKSPEVLGVRISAVRSKLEYLIERGFELSAIRALVKRFPFFLRVSLEQDLQPTLDLLLEYASKGTIHEIFYKCPQLLAKSYAEEVHPKFHFFVELGYDPVDLRVLLEKFPEVLCYSLDEEIMPAVQRSIEIGLSMMQTRITFARHPELFRQTILKVNRDAERDENH